MTTDISNTIFQKAFAFVNQTGKHVFLTGKAGTGKTTFLKHLCQSTYKKLAVVAPTGVAAINAGGVTIHSFFQLPFGPFLPVSNYSNSYEGEMNNPASLVKNLRLTHNRRNVIRELDLLVIDEISMVRADLLDAMDTVLRHVRRQPHVAFGGVQLLYIGDLFQLPPVVRQEEWQILKEHYSSPFFFDAHAIKQLPPLYIELKKIYRQKDDAFINILNNIRNNCCSVTDLEFLHKYYKPDFIPAKKDNYITLTSHNVKADTINNYELAKLPGETYTYSAEIKGNFSESAYPVDKLLYLKEGAQVMFIKNDKGEKRKFYNGKIGTIKRVEKERVTVVFPNEREELQVEPETWRNIRYDYDTTEDQVKEEELGTFKQYPLRLAWAITIHKSQGLTFEKAVIDAGASFAPGQVYVSLSRLTGLGGLVLHSQIPAHTIMTDERVIDYVRGEMSEELLQQTLEEEQRVFVRTELVRCFGWEKLVEVVAVHHKSYEHRQIPGKARYVEWSENLLDNINDQHSVALKFRSQLEKLYTNCRNDGHVQLNERVQAAAAYFTSAIEVSLLASLKTHIKEIRQHKKTKSYLAGLAELEVLFERKKQNLQRAVQLASALQKSENINDILELVKAPQKTAVIAALEKGMPLKADKLPKGETKRISLKMFKEGKPVQQIAADRNLTAGTIETHLAAFIPTGEVVVYDLVSKEQVERIKVLLNSVEELSHSDIRNMLENKVSYGAIKAVVNHLTTTNIANAAPF